MKTISVLLSVLFFTVSVNAQSDSLLVRTGADGKSWTIGNALVEREVRFESQRGLHSVSWRHVVTGTDFMSAAGPNRSGGGEFSFEAYGDSFAGSNGPAWQFVGAETQGLAPSGKLLIIKLRAKAKPIEVAVFYAVYEGHPVVRKWIAITNRGEKDVTLSHLSFESVSIAPGPASVL